MATIQKKNVKGHQYWYIVESRRINGKPRPVVLKYLGTADSLLRQLEAGLGNEELISYAHGGVMALTQAARELGLEALIDGHAGASRRGESVGRALAWAAIHRVLAPGSKRAWREWADGTSLAKIYGTRLPTHPSSFFWDQMDAVSDKALERIQHDICRQLVQQTGLTPETLFYDTTNCYTYIDTRNLANTIAARGHNKQKRHDLRQYGLLMMVDEENRLPLAWSVYEGQRNDVDVFAAHLPQLGRRLKELGAHSKEGPTLVYDGGNISRDNQKSLESLGFHYVARFPVCSFPTVFTLKADAFEPIAGDDRYQAWRSREIIWDVDRTVVVIYSRRLHQRQWGSLLRALGRSLVKLRHLAAELETSRRRRQRRPLERRIEQILAIPFLKRVLSVTIEEPQAGHFRLRYTVDQRALEHLKHQVFGRRVIITDRHQWSTERIVAAYHGQSRIERVFRDLKADRCISIQPQYHWTDHKIRVHTFICVLAYVLAARVRATAEKAGYRGSLSRLFRELDRIRLVCRIEKRTTPGRPKLRWQLEKCDPELMRLYRHIVPAAAEPEKYPQS